MGSLNKKASDAQCFIMALGLFWDIATGLPWTPNGAGSLEPKEYCIFLPGAHYLTINSPNGADSSLNKLLLLLYSSPQPPFLHAVWGSSVSVLVRFSVKQRATFTIIKIWFDSMESSMHICSITIQMNTINSYDVIYSITKSAMNYDIIQWFPTCGPRARSGPPGFKKWPSTSWRILKIYGAKSVKLRICHGRPVGYEPLCPLWWK